MDDAIRKFLEYLSELEYLDRTMFIAILCSDKDKYNEYLGLYEILDKPIPDFVRACENATTFEFGRSVALDDLVGSFLTFENKGEN